MGRFLRDQSLPLGWRGARGNLDNTTDLWFKAGLVWANPFPRILETYINRPKIASGVIQFPSGIKTSQYQSPFSTPVFTMVKGTTLGRVRAYWLGAVVCMGGFLFGYDSGM